MEHNKISIPQTQNGPNCDVGDHGLYGTDSIDVKIWADQHNGELLPVGTGKRFPAVVLDVATDKTVTIKVFLPIDHTDYVRSGVVVVDSPAWGRFWHKPIPKVAQQ